MSKKGKKILIGVLATLLILIGGGILGVNLYIDSILNKMDKTENFKEKEVKANQIEGNVDNIALLGVDAEGGDGSRTDVIKIISVDFDNKKIKITSVQRDNLVYQPMQDRYEKLNHAYAYDGAQGTLSTLNYNFDLDITQYVKFEFASVEQIVNILGGVDINLTAEEAASLGFGSAGIYHLDGAKALSYSRIRNLDSDYGRMQRQNNVINAVLAGVSGKSAFELLDIVNSVMPYLETNISNGTIKNYATSMISFDLHPEQYQFPSGGYDSILTSLSLYGYSPHYVLKDFAGEVKILHDNIYGGNYQVSDTVNKVDQETKAMAGY